MSYTIVFEKNSEYGNPIGYPMLLVLVQMKNWYLIMKYHLMAYQHLSIVRFQSNVVHNFMTYVSSTKSFDTYQFDTDSNCTIFLKI